MAPIITNVSEYQPLAKEKLPKQAYDYYASGAEDQWTLAENTNAFSRIRSVCCHFQPLRSVQVIVLCITH